MKKEYYDKDGDLISGSVDDHIEIALEIGSDKSIECQLEMATDYISDATGLKLEGSRWDIYLEIVDYIYRSSMEEKTK